MNGLRFRIFPLAGVTAWRRIFLSIFVGAAGISLAGCGSGRTPAPPPQGVVITQQPLSQTVPIGSAATFTVKATGAAPLRYQWSENGAEISGATGATYTTPTVALGPGGSTAIGSFQVTVSNGVNSAASKSAALTAGPRSPKAGDLRYLLFQQVDAPGLFNNGGLNSLIDVKSGVGSVNASGANAVGTPLTMGSSFACAGDECAWPFAYYFLPPPMTGLSMYYHGGEYSNFMPDLQSYAAPNVVFTSLDLEPGFNAYAVSWVKTFQPGGFDYRIDPLVPPGADQPGRIQAQANLDGTESRVITAVSFDASGNAVLISYGWTGDTTTVYEDQAYFVAPGSDVSANVLSAATTLANDGYVISAFGGNDVDGYILIGMRVQGDTLPRPIHAASPDNLDRRPYVTAVVDLYQRGVNGRVATLLSEQ